jgi:hypothetical protein
VNCSERWSLAAPDGSKVLPKMAAEAQELSLLLEAHARPSHVQPSRALAMLSRHRGPVLIDLDETLYLRNSTEDFIDCARPALLALLLMRLLDAIRPWRWTGGDLTRDVWRVRCIMLLFPWTRSVWARRAASLAATAANMQLISALNKRFLALNCEAPVIVTAGFEAIVAPLVAALMPDSPQVIATRHSVFADRLAGKVQLIVAKLGLGIIERALVITDSEQDAELLAASAVPLRVIWPRARFRPAHSGVYLPGQYISQVKHRGERYFTQGILQEDFALWVLASLTFTQQPLLHIIGLLFLLLSFWAIYERGYVDNDGIAARFEREPALSEAYFESPVATPRAAPWVWAAASGATGTLILRGPNMGGVYAFGAWMAVLLATYGFFLTYNRSDKQTRIWWYGGLQLARAAAFVAVVSVSVIGALAIGAHVLAKWVPYYVYRQGNNGWPKSTHLLPRLLFFILLALVLSFATGYSLLLSWPAAALLAWNVFRSRHDLRRAVRAAAPSSEAHAQTFY